MTNPIVDELVGPWFLPFPHQAILKFANDLSEEMLSKQPSSTAPPIAWHVFHIARWADRLQASLPNRLQEDSHPSELPRQIWLVEETTNAWGVDPSSLGWLETGAGMTIEQSLIFASVGRARLAEYATKAFLAADEETKKLHDHELTQARNSIIPSSRRDQTTGGIETTGSRQTTVLFDLLFHLSHASRHMGMIEALKGTMFAIEGTATV
jgi:hypothetical protein